MTNNLQNIYTLPEQKKYFYEIKKEYFHNPLNFDGFLLTQLGRVFCQNNTVINTHLHGNYFELTIVNSGEGTITTNGFPTHAKLGDIYLSFPCDQHKIESDFQNPLKYDFLAFQSSVPSFHNELEKIIELFYSPRHRLFQDEKIRFLVGNAIEELNNDFADSDALLSSIFRQILIYLIRDFKALPQKNKLQGQSRAELLCFKLMNYIDTHIYTLKSLNELSDLAGYSYSYLSTVFRKVTSNSLSNYYHERKLEIARILVLENRLKYTEIAEQLNYASLYAFSKAFHNRFQMSPREYYNRSKAESPRI